MSNFELSILFFLQLAVILLVCRFVGLVIRVLGQPQVVGEMIAGILLGPSLFGLFWPEWQAWLFPPPPPGVVAAGAATGAVSSDSMKILYSAAQVGLVLYMFVVGVEFRGDLLRSQAKQAVTVSLAGMAGPIVLGGMLVLLLHGDDKGLFTGGMGLWHAMLFMAAAMSITAFPTLARIIQERRLGGTRLGTLVLAAGSINDAAAWCMLAAVLAMSGGAARPLVQAALGANVNIAVVAIVGGLAYTVAVMLLVRPMLLPFAKVTQRRGELTHGHLTFVLMVLMVGAWFTDVIGIYAVFGAFIFGVCVPRGMFADELRKKIEPLTTSLLLPLFFVYSGLNTKVGLVDTPWLWTVAGLVLLAACAGKGVACYAAARMNGADGREATAVGALMNARGLMELILLNIVYEKGLITQTLFSIMVMMALVTTLMATPIFDLVYGRRRAIQEPATNSKGTNGHAANGNGNAPAEVAAGAVAGEEVGG